LRLSLQQRERLVEVLRGNRLAVEVCVAELLQQGQNPLSLVRQGQDRGRLALDRPHGFECRDDLAEIVPVYRPRVPPEGGELALDRVHVKNPLRRSRLLEVVSVDDDGEIIEPILGGGRRSLPDLAFPKLSVARQDIRVVRLLVDPRRERVPDPDRKTL